MLYRFEGIFDNALTKELGKIGEIFSFLHRCPIRVLNVAPVAPRDGDTAICDGTNWNPIADGVKRPVWYDGTAAVWKKFT